MILLILGLIFQLKPLLLLGIVLFSCVVFFQVVNLPVEFDASARAKRQLVDLGVIRDQELREVSKVLNAAALTYVAATLQAILTLLGRDNLRRIVDDLGIDDVDRRSVDGMRARLSRARNVSAEDLLGHEIFLKMFLAK